jgi:hypothetical protein
MIDAMDLALVAAGRRVGHPIDQDATINDLTARMRKISDEARCEKPQSPSARSESTDDSGKKPGKNGQ